PPLLAHLSRPTPPPPISPLFPYTTLSRSERGDVGAAADALESALRAYPSDYDAINDLIEIAGDAAPSRITDAMMRAFELERQPDNKRRLGLALTVRLLRASRLEPARETIARLAEEHPDDLKVLMLLAEVHAGRESWSRAMAALERIAEHPEAPS